MMKVAVGLRTPPYHDLLQVLKVKYFAKCMIIVSRVQEDG